MTDTPPRRGILTADAALVAAPAVHAQPAARPRGPF